MAKVTKSPISTSVNRSTASILILPFAPDVILEIVVSFLFPEKGTVLPAGKILESSDIGIDMFSNAISAI